MIASPDGLLRLARCLGRLRFESGPGKRGAYRAGRPISGPEQSVLGGVLSARAVHATLACSSTHAVDIMLEATVFGKGLYHLVFPGHLGNRLVDPPAEVRDEAVGPRCFPGTQPPGVPFLGDLLLYLIDGILRRVGVISQEGW